jgi:tetratricopeptide (TPR) repeat protein
MSTDNMAAQIGHAWGHQRAGEPEVAIKEFEQILRQDPDNIDALYGIGLAQRTAGRYEEALENFQHALAVVDDRDSAGRTAREAAANDFQTERIKPNTPEDDRYMMLTRMLKQRIDETQRAKARQS